MRTSVIDFYLRLSGKVRYYLSGRVFALAQVGPADTPANNYKPVHGGYPNAEQLLCGYCKPWDHCVYNRYCAQHGITMDEA